MNLYTNYLYNILDPKKINKKLKFNFGQNLSKKYICMIKNYFLKTYQNIFIYKRFRKRVK